MKNFTISEVCDMNRVYVTKSKKNNSKQKYKENTKGALQKYYQNLKDISEASSLFLSKPT